MTEQEKQRILNLAGKRKTAHKNKYK